MRLLLSQHATVPPEVLALVASMSDWHPVAVLKTAISALGARDLSLSPSPDDVRTEGLQLVARIPTIVGAHHAARRGAEAVAPAPNQSHAERFLTLFSGTTPPPSTSR